MDNSTVDGRNDKMLLFIGFIQFKIKSKGIKTLHNDGSLHYIWGMKNVLLSLLAGISLLTVSCDNTIELEAPYKETGVIYGLLNPADSIHYVRIQKAFLGKGNANTQAQVFDSTYYPDILDVRMLRIKNGAVISTFPLTRTVGPDKDPGLFPNSPNILYKSNGEEIFDDSEYRIIVTNTQTGYEFFGQTALVDPILVLRPNPTDVINWANQNGVLVDYNPPQRGKINSLTIRFKYLEQDLGVGTAETKFIDWVFPYVFLTQPEQVSSVKDIIQGESFYKFVGQSLLPGNFLRQALTMDFIFTSGGETFANYVNINSSASTLATTPPYYSNIIGGTGIFSSKVVKVVPNLQLHPDAKGLLITSPYTASLGFQ